MELERRVRRLETENRRLRLFSLLVLVGIGSVFLMGQGAAVSNQVQTRHFSVVDASGRALVEIRPEGPAGAALILADNRGAFEIALRTRGDGAELSLDDKKAGKRTVLAASAGARRLAFHDKGGIVADLGVGAEGPALVLSGPGGEAQVRAGAQGPSVSTTNPQGQPVWRRP